MPRYEVLLTTGGTKVIEADHCVEAGDKFLFFNDVEDGREEIVATIRQEIVADLFSTEIEH